MDPTEVRQMPFDLTPHPSYARASFLPADCNRRALARILAWRDWPARKLVVSGPEASGKTHLASIWAVEAGARMLRSADLAAADPTELATGDLVVEDADRVAGAAAQERALLHVHNVVAQAGRTLLLTARARPGQWGVVLPDLASRIAAADHVRLDPPDDALLAAVLVKLFDDRQMRVSPALVTWLVTRMDRSLATANRIVAELDARALAAGGPVTRRMAEAVLDNLDATPP